MPVPHTPTGQHRSRGRSGQGASASASPASGTASCHASPRQPLLTTRSKTPTPTKGPSIPADQYCITTAETPKRMLELIEIAKTRWLAKTEIHEILTNTTQFALRVSEAQIHLPPSGTLVLYDRATMRRFRKDGHDWVTKRSANTTREDRSRLKVNGTAIDCHYAHGISPRSFHRRIYQLQGNSLNLVHYLDDGQVDKADPASTSSTARRLLLGSGKSQRQSHRNHADGQASSSTSVAHYCANTSNNGWFGIRDFCPKSIPASGDSEIMLCTRVQLVVPDVDRLPASYASATGAAPIPEKLPDVWTLQPIPGQQIPRSPTSSSTSESRKYFLCVRFGHTAVKATVLGPCCIRVTAPPLGPATAKVVNSGYQQSPSAVSLQLCFVSCSKFAKAPSLPRGRVGCGTTSAVLEPTELGDARIYRACSRGKAAQYIQTTPMGSSDPMVPPSDSVVGGGQGWDAFHSAHPPRSHTTNLHFGSKRKRTKHVQKARSTAAVSFDSSSTNSLGWRSDTFVTAAESSTFGFDGTSLQSGPLPDHDSAFDADDEDGTSRAPARSSRATKMPNSFTSIDHRSLERLNEGDLTKVCSSLLERTVQNLQVSTIVGPSAPESQQKFIQEVNRLDDDGLSLLHYACLCRNHALASKLLQSRADPNLRSRDGETPLLMAVSSGATFVVRALLAHRADAALTNAKDGVSPLQVAAVNGFDEIAAAIRSSGSYGEEVPQHILGAAGEVGILSSHNSGAFSSDESEGDGEPELGEADAGTAEPSFVAALDGADGQQQLLERAFESMTLRDKCALSLADPAKEHLLFGVGAGTANRSGEAMPTSVNTAMGSMSAADREGVYQEVELIQKNIRSWLLRKSYVKLRESSKQVQAVARGKRARQTLARKERAATTLSKEMKKFMAKRKFQKLKNATQSLKSAWRRKKEHEKTRLQKLISAAMIIKKNMRNWRLANTGSRRAPGARMGRSSRAQHSRMSSNTSRASNFADAASGVGGDSDGMASSDFSPGNDERDFLSQPASTHGMPSPLAAAAAASNTHSQSPLMPLDGLDDMDMFADLGESADNDFGDSNAEDVPSDGDSFGFFNLPAMT